MELFLALNGYDPAADDADCVLTAMALSDVFLTEQALFVWLMENILKNKY